MTPVKGKEQEMGRGRVLGPYPSSDILFKKKSTEEEEGDLGRRSNVALGLSQGTGTLEWRQPIRELATMPALTSL